MSLTEADLLIANELQKQYPHLDRLQATTIVWFEKYCDPDSKQRIKDGSDALKADFPRLPASHKQGQDDDSNAAGRTVSA